MRQRQLTLSFTPQPQPPDPDAVRRREVAEAIAERRSGRKIDHLIKTGVAPDMAEAQKLIVVQCIHRLKDGLRDFLKYLHTGDIAKSRQQQDAAGALLNKFDALSEVELAQRLKALGFCESTGSYKREIGKHFRTVLWTFRTAMIQADLWTQSPKQHNEQRA